MIFKRLEPTPRISQWVECFWIIENDDPKQVIQKIIPDGFPELIFHFGEPYEINLSGGWEVQNKNLLAGQIKKFFWLRNTGKASMLGIKLKPAAPALGFNIPMADLTDKVENIDALPNRALQSLTNEVRSVESFDNRVQAASRFFENLPQVSNPVEDAVALIFTSQGLCSVSSIAETLKISERQLERLFKQYVGLSPKFYSRIIRFSTIFQLKEKGDPSWMDLTYEAGFADQSHFIRNFKSFTGEDPTGYSFGAKNMANFFMQKK
jgi:AraC-like DNA-binding protein